LSRKPDPCMGGMPFPPASREEVFTDPPLDLADPPLAYLSLGVAEGVWQDPPLRIHGPSGYTMIMKGAGRILEAWPHPPYRKKCLWIPPSCPFKAYEALAELLGGFREDGLFLVNPLPRSFAGIVETSVGELFLSIKPGSVVTIDEGYVKAHKAIAVGPGSYRLGNIGWIIGDEGLALRIGGSVFQVIVDGKVEKIYRYSSWIRGEAGSTVFYATSVGLEISGADEITIIHGYYDPLVLWMHPFSIAEEHLSSGVLESWWVSICGAHCISVTSPKGVRVDLRGGEATISSKDKHLAITPHTPGTPILAVEAAMRTRCKPLEAHRAPLITPVWRLDAGGILVYDAWVRGDEVRVALVNLAYPRLATFKVPGLIREAWVMDAWMGRGDRLEPSYDRVKIPLARGPSMLLLRVHKSPLAGLRRMVSHGVS